MLEIELQMVAFTSVSSFSGRRGAATSEAGSGSTAGSVGFVVVFSSTESATFVFIGTGSTHFKLKAKRTNGIVFCVEIVDVLRVCFLRVWEVCPVGFDNSGRGGVYEDL